MIYQKARELGENILNSDYGLMLQEAKQNFESNESLNKKYLDYTNYQSAYIDKLKKKELTPVEIAREQKKIEAMNTELNHEEDLVRLLNAEEEFNNYVNGILEILKLTISGESTCGSSSGGCSGCGVR